MEEKTESGTGSTREGNGGKDTEGHTSGLSFFLFGLCVPTLLRRNNTLGSPNGNEVRDGMGEANVLCAERYVVAPEKCDFDHVFAAICRNVLERIYESVSLVP